MGSRERNKIRRCSQRGSTLYVVAGSLVILLGMGALAIDLASLYVARNESQRAADAAALAGAKVFVESGCVTSGDCTSQEGTATDRATQVAGQILVGGQPVTIQSISFNETSQNPQITVQVQSANLSIYFAGVVGVTTAPTVGASATAEAYNPSGTAGGPTFCTGCLRPWLIANCNPSFPSPGCLLNSGSNYSVANPGCVTSGGVVGEPIQIAIETDNTHFGAVDDGGGLASYQQSITTCNTGQRTCGMMVTTLPDSPPGTKTATTTSSVDTLLHIGSGNVGLNQGQDWIDTSLCPPQIHAGALNPLVNQGVIGQDAAVATSDSIVTAYIFEGTLSPPVLPLPLHQPVENITIKGFAQIFVTQVDSNGDVWGVILGVAGCGSSGGSCGGSGSIQGPTMLPVRLIQGAD
jgi:hypothetical protein